MNQNYKHYLPDLPSTILFLLFCAIYYVKFGQNLSIHTSLVSLTHDWKLFLLSLFARL